MISIGQCLINRRSDDPGIDCHQWDDKDVSLLCLLTAGRSHLGVHLLSYKLTLVLTRHCFPCRIKCGVGRVDTLKEIITSSGMESAKGEECS